MEISIRPATTDDLDSLVPIQMEVQQLHVQAHPHRYCDVPANQLRGWMAETIIKENWHVMLAMLGGNIVGYVIIEIRAPAPSPFSHPIKFAAIDQLVVLSPARRKGVATRLMGSAEEFARAQGCSEVQLAVLEFNEEAKRFYSRSNYATVQRRMKKYL